MLAAWVCFCTCIVNWHCACTMYWQHGYAFVHASSTGALFDCTKHWRHRCLRALASSTGFWTAQTIGGMGVLLYWLSQLVFLLHKVLAAWVRFCTCIVNWYLDCTMYCSTTLRYQSVYRNLVSAEDCTMSWRHGFAFVPAVAALAGVFGLKRLAAVCQR